MRLKSGQAVVLPVAVRVLVVQVPTAHQLQGGRPVDHLAACRGDVQTRVLVLDRGREVHGDAAQRVDHARETGEVDRHVVVDRDAEDLLDRLHEQVGTGVECGIDAVHARDPADVPRDVDPEVPGDGEDGHRLGGGVEPGHHGDVAALTPRVGLVTECVDLRGIRDEGPGVGADEEQVEWLAGWCLGNQVLRVDLLDLVEAVGRVDVQAPDAQGRDQDDEGERVERAPPPAMAALLLLLARLPEVGLEVGSRPGRPGVGLVGVGRIRTSRGRQGSRTRKYLAGRSGSLHRCISTCQTNCSSSATRCGGSPRTR